MPVSNALPLWQTLQQTADGTLFFEPVGMHFIQVEKTGNRVELIFLDQTTLSSKWVQSIVDVTQPEVLVADYTQAMCLPLLWSPNPERVYLAGLGGGRLAYGLHHHLPTTRLDCVDIEPVLVKVSQDFFGLQQDNYLQVRVEDGRQYLENRSPSSGLYDLMWVDVALGNGYTPYAMATQEFFELCQVHLSPLGTLVINFLPIDPWYPQKVHTLRQVFPCLALCALPKGNRVVFARSVDIPDQTTWAQGEEWVGRTIAPWWDKLQALPMGRNLGTADIFHDAFPPPAYFDQLPAFNTLFAKVAPEVPCPCGSGQPYRLCHAIVRGAL